LGITGGVGTGKTTFTKSLYQFLDADIFDSDACARDLLDADPEIHRKVREHFGLPVFDKAGKPDRKRLREIVFADAVQRRALEEILHPEIRSRWMALAAAAQKRWLFIDIPLLFETHTEQFFDRIAVVACSHDTQLLRLAGRQLPADIAMQMVAAQLPIELKIQKAGHVIWNESSLTALHEQARIFAAYLKQQHG
jgi:dephospho-CoA kinase